MDARKIVLLAAAVLAPGPAHAADTALDGATLSWPWALPFAGILLTIAFAPLLVRRFWHRHYGKLAFVWATLTLAPMAALRDVDTAAAALSHALLADYLGFIAILFALYVVAGGILVTGTLRGTPLLNTALLAFGTLIASVVGTTGAAMILIRPLLRANGRGSTTSTSWCFSSSWSAISAARCRRSAIRRCSSAFSTASISSGRRSLCGSPRRSPPAACSPSSSRSICGFIARIAKSRRSAKTACASRSPCTASSISCCSRSSSLP
jgi:hypothetical protein